VWGSYRVEGDVLFPDDRHNYLGIVYNYRESGGRADFGSLYLKGNGSYIRAYLVTLEVPEGARERLVFSSMDDLALWHNGRFLGYTGRETFAWHDVGLNPDHPPTDWIDLDPGVHRVLVRIRGGAYASGGFFARRITVRGD